MNFFEQLAAPGNVDMTIRIMQKGEKLTLNVMPGSGQSVTSPIIMTGTPQDLDSSFFSDLYPQVKEVVGIINNISTVKAQAETKAAAAAKKKEPPAQKTTKEKSPKKKTGIKKEHASLFDQPEETETENPEEDNTGADKE